MSFVSWNHVEPTSNGAASRDNLVCLIKLFFSAWHHINSLWAVVDALSKPVDHGPSKSIRFVPDTKRQLDTEEVKWFHMKSKTWVAISYFSQIRRKAANWIFEHKLVKICVSLSAIHLHEAQEKYKFNLYGAEFPEGASHETAKGELVGRIIFTTCDRQTHRGKSYAQRNEEQTINLTNKTRNLFFMLIHLWKCIIKYSNPRNVTTDRQLNGRISEVKRPLFDVKVQVDEVVARNLISSMKHKRNSGDRTVHRNETWGILSIIECLSSSADRTL